MAVRPTIGQVTLRLLCILALLTAGFGHRFAVGGNADAVDLSAYALPDGALPSLCLGLGGDGDGDGTQESSDSCDVCRLAASVDLPPPKTMPASRYNVRPVTFGRPGGPDVRRLAHLPAAPPRAPPIA